MTATHHANSGVAGGTSAVTVAVLPTISAGDLLLMFVGYWNSGAAAPTLGANSAGWNLLTTNYGGGGTYGLDTGPRGVAAYWYDTNVSGVPSVAPTVNNGGADAGAGIGAEIISISGTLGEWATPVAVTATDATSGTGLSFAYASDPGGTTGDLAYIGNVWIPDNATIASPAFTWTGTTGVSSTNTGASANTNGHDARITTYSTGTLTGGPSSAAPTWGGTLSATPGTGVSIFVRVRDQAPTRTGTLAATASFSATAVQVGVRAGTLAATAVFTATAVEATPSRTGTLAATAALTATASEVEVTTGTLAATAAITATAREVEIATGTLAGTAALTAAVREVEVTTGALSATAVFTATARPVAVTTGVLSATALLTAIAVVAAKPGPIILVEIGDWSQEWELGQDLDAGDVTMINAEGAILDGLTAQWSSDRLMAQPTPTEVSFSIYVPEGAVGPSLDEGVLSHIRIVPPSYTDNPDYLPLLDTYGTVTYGAARPVAQGLSFGVIHTDHLAGLGETMVGAVKWKGGGYDDLAEPVPGQFWWDRFHRLRHAMDLDHQTLQWDPIDYWSWAGDPPVAAWDPLEAFSVPTSLGPAFPDRPGEPAPTNEVAEQILRQTTKWGPNYQANPGPLSMANVWRMDGSVDFHQTVESQSPSLRTWSDLYTRPVLFATEDEGRFRLAWVSPRVEGNAGLPLTLELTDKLRLTAVPLDGTTIPDSSKYGAWVPGCAVPKDDVEWAVDKDAHPRQARGTGYFRANVGGDEINATDWLVGYPYSPGRKGAELQIELPELTSDTDVDAVFMAQPEALLWSLVGYWYDTLPQYELATVPIRYDAITDPDQWPRLFQQPDQDSRVGSLDWWAGAQGRFIFVYDIADRWHPYGLSYWWGFLKGATLTVESGKITATAELAHREAGPNGPRGTPTAVDGSDRWKLLVGDAPASVTWDQWNADPDLAALLPADIDPSVRWAALYLTTL